MKLLSRLFFISVFILVFVSGEVFSQSENVISAIKFKDADINIVLQSIAEKAVKGGKKVNIVTSPNVHGLVSVNLESVDWQTAMKVILKAYDYGYEWVGENIVLVAPLDELADKRKKSALAKEAEPLETKTFILSFAKVADLQGSIASLLTERGRLTSDSRANALVVVDTQSSLEVVEKAIRNLDTITPQVLVEAKIVETNLNKSENLGIKWNLKVSASGSKRPTTWPFTSEVKGTGSKMFPVIQTPSELERVNTTETNASGDSVTSSEERVWNKLAPGFPAVSADEFTFGTLDFSQMQVVLEALAARSGTEIVSNPKITTLDNSPASIKVATEWPIPRYTYNKETGTYEITGFEYKPIGVTLNVLPQINQEGYITMDIRPEVSEIIGEVAFGGTASLPLVNTQTTATKVMVKNGETLVIGGLIKDKKGDNYQKIPILGDIPFLGRIFKYKSKTGEKKDLLIFITPKIITPKRE
ncbi:MAG: type IV pilus secretin PilQ [Candidatus Omnitrophica bacterium]|nr:type IV pilus secretin PilQ [Candidatus Omnitrophota bacterium]